MAKKEPTKTTPKKVRKPGWAERFLKRFAECGNVTAAAKYARIHRDTAYERRKTDPEFAKQWHDAETSAVEGLELEAHRRAVKGVLRPVYHAGKRVGLIHEYSDTLLIFLLKARKPETYRENARIVHASDAANPLEMKHTHEHRISASPEDLAAVAALLGAAGLGVPPHGGQEPVDPAQAVPKTAPVPPPQ
jgi:hypothetical protein